MEEDHQNIYIVDNSVCFNAYKLLLSRNMWYNTNVLKIHPNGMATLKKERKEERKEERKKDRKRKKEREMNDCGKNPQK